MTNKTRIKSEKQFVWHSNELIISWFEIEPVVQKMFVFTIHLQSSQINHIEYPTLCHSMLSDNAQLLEL